MRLRLKAAELDSTVSDRTSPCVLVLPSGNQIDGEVAQAWLDFQDGMRDYLLNLANEVDQM